MLSRLALLLVLVASLARAAPAPGAVRLDQGALLLEAPAWSARLTTTADGLLRLTAAATGVTARPLPFRIDRPPGPPVTQVGSHFKAGAFDLVPDDHGTLAIFLGERRLGALRLDRASPETLSARLELDGATTFHGLGQAFSSTALTKGRFQLSHTPRYGDQTYLYIPYLVADTGAALYANTASSDVITLEEGRIATLRTATGSLDLYLFGPDSPSDAAARFYEFSQSKSLLPRWAYGYLQSKYGYRTDDEVRHVVTTFQRLGVPLSAIVLDLYWYHRMGDFAWNREAFPDPKALDAWLEQQRVKLITITEPFVAQDSLAYPALQDAGALARGPDGGTLGFADWWDFGHAGGAIFDPTQASTQRLLGERYAALLADGVDGFWLDLGEPERVPPQARFGPYTEDEYHDFFNLEWARLVRASVERAAPGRRPFLLSRSGWTGIAGLSVATWSGDVPATWEGLQGQIPLGLNASLSGLPYWGCDVGGFVSPGPSLMPPDPELSYRWQQLGALLPVDRAHGAGPREPWIYGPQWLQRIAQAIKLRARLGPYLYSTAYQVYAQGLPMMRPLTFLEPTQPRWHHEDAQFLLGDFLLASPVLDAMERTPTHTVRLPQGTWYELATLQPVQGDQTLTVTLDTFPVYARAGAIVPLDLGEEQPEAVLLLPGPTATTFTIFTDDGQTEAYRAGAGEKLVVRLDAAGVTFSGATRARAVTLLFRQGQPLPTLGRRATQRAPYLAVTVQLTRAPHQRFAF